MLQTSHPNKNKVFLCEIPETSHRNVVALLESKNPRKGSLGSVLFVLYGLKSFLKSKIKN